MNDDFTKFNPQLVTYARENRRKMTPQESKLWYQFLKDHPVKFYRQRPIGNYIVDFYCSKAKLVIEVDSWIHYEDQFVKYDKKRTAYLKKQGLSVMRIENEDIDDDYEFEGIKYTIDQTLKKILGNDIF